MANTQVQCPNCGSFATKPTHGEGLGREQDAMAKIASDFSFGLNRFSFDNPKWVQKFKSLQVSAVCETCKFMFKANTVLAKSSPTNAPTSSPKKATAERLAELDQLRAKRVITEDEYKRKREEILRDL